MGDETEARALLEIERATLGRWGRARRSPTDPQVPRIGDELATARALGDLVHRILDVTALEVEQFSAGEVHLHTRDAASARPTILLADGRQEPRISDGGLSSASSSGPPLNMLVRAA
jgi:hypothetical protein